MNKSQRNIGSHISLASHKDHRKTPSNIKNACSKTRRKKISNRLWSSRLKRGIKNKSRISIN